MPPSSNDNSHYETVGTSFAGNNGEKACAIFYGRLCCISLVFFCLIDKYSGFPVYEKRYGYPKKYALHKIIVKQKMPMEN